MSLSSTFLCERPGVPAGTPFKRLCCVNRMLMVASSTSDRLCRTCVMQRTRDQGEAAESERYNVSPTSSLKFLKAATLSSTLSWLSGRSFKRSITWKTQRERGGASLKDVFFFAAIVSCAMRSAWAPWRLHSRRRLCPRGRRGTRRRRSSGRGAGRKCCRWTSPRLIPERDTCKKETAHCGVWLSDLTETTGTAALIYQPYARQKSACTRGHFQSSADSSLDVSVRAAHISHQQHRRR